MIIKSKFILIAALAIGSLLPANVEALDFRIELGDRPYYTHGARYWRGDWEYIWVPGHRYRGRWVRGHYRRGEHRRNSDRWRHRRDRGRGHR